MSRAGDKPYETSRSRWRSSPLFAWTKSADHLAIDPVCQMAVDPEHAVGRLLLDEKAYYFCSLTCAAAFAQHSERYAEGRL
jgi:YHS domain-containing protein